MTGGNFAQTKYHPPLDIPLVLASNFGELRPNHFHMGLDFKTNGVTGLKLYAIEKGFVKRVVVSPYGYGKVVYIQHPNGHTSVYAHCQEFQGKLQTFVENKIISLRDNQIDLELSPTDVPITRGEVFALSGNTGSSTAPHLHFELRESLTDAALNPLKYGFELDDHKKPEIYGLKVYAVTREGYRYPNFELKKSVKGTDGNFAVSDVINIPSLYCSRTGGIGFSFDMIDHLDGASNKCGVYGYDLYINDQLKYSTRIDKVPFESTRYVNSHKDYEAYAIQGQNYHKAYHTDQNSLPIYGKSNGIIPFKPGDSASVMLKVYDASNNVSTLNFRIKIEEGTINPVDGLVSDPSYLNPCCKASYNKGNVFLKFPEESVYEPMRMNIENFSKSIGQKEVPVQSAYSMKVRNVTNGVDTNYYLLFRTAKGRTRVVSSKVQGKDILANEVKYFGDFYIAKDSIAPSIRPDKVSLGKDRTLTWKISDHQSGLLKYQLTIGDRWIPLDYEYKNNTLSAVLPSDVQSTPFTVTLIVTDKCGNKSTWEKSY